MYGLPTPHHCTTSFVFISKSSTYFNYNLYSKKLYNRVNQYLKFLFLVRNKEGHLWNILRMNKIKYLLLLLKFSDDLVFKCFCKPWYNKDTTPLNEHQRKFYNSFNWWEIIVTARYFTFGFSSHSRFFSFCIRHIGGMRLSLRLRIKPANIKQQPGTIYRLQVSI